MGESSNLQEILKPFYQRASEAEERLARLEAAAAASKRSPGDEQLTKMISELQSQLEELKAERAAEREKALKENQQLAAENAKLKYRILHLIHAAREAADDKLASK